jgi:hypothetical protein
MTTEGAWIGYSGTARIGLAVALLAVAGGVAYAGTRWPGPFALMLAVFAVWALAGFGYPSAPVPIALNVVSKILAFVTVLTLFLLPRRQAGVSGPQAGAAQALR